MLVNIYRSLFNNLVSPLMYFSFLVSEIYIFNKFLQNVKKRNSLEYYILRYVIYLFSLLSLKKVDLFTLKIE